MNPKRTIWRWLRWVLLVVVGLPMLGVGVLVAIAWLKPAWLESTRVALPPPVLAPDSVRGPLHAFAGPPRELVRILGPAANALSVPSDDAIRLLGDLGDPAEVRVFGGLGQYRLHLGEEEAETTVRPVGGWRAGEVVTVRVPGSQLRQFTVRTRPGGAFGGQLAVAVGRQPAFLQLGDADGDGDLDAFVLNLGSSDQAVSELLNDGHGGFTLGQSVDLYPHEPANLVVGDLNGDGAADLVTSDVGSQLAATWLNDGHGKFTIGWGVDPGPTDPSPSESDVRGDSSAALADVDGDGDLDLLFARWSRHGAVTIRFNDGTGAFGGGSTVAVDSYPSAPALGDVDGDGDLDLVTANYGAVRNSASVRLNDGQGNFGGGQDVTAGARPHGVLLGDVNGDGRLDLLTRDGSHTAWLCLGDGPGRFRPRRPVYLNCALEAFALSDVDGDGDLDLVGAVQPEAADPRPARVAIWLNDGRGELGAHNQKRLDVRLPTPAGSIALGDVDRSGTPDLLATAFDTVVVRLNQPPR